MATLGILVPKHLFYLELEVKESTKEKMLPLQSQDGSWVPCGLCKGLGAVMI